MKNLVLRMAPVLLAVCLGGCKSGMFVGPLEDHLIYQPSGPPRREAETPHLSKEDVWFTTADGVKLHGWYCPVANPRAVVLFAHGNGGNLEDRWERLRMIANRLGATVLAFDYRGYGSSEGKPTDEGIVADARAARRFLAETSGVAEGDIILYGQSLGGAVMIDLAAADGARALILESTFTSLSDVADYKFPLTPPGKLLKDRFNSVAKISNYHGPLLIMHGAEDRLVPIAQGKSLYAAANQPKSFVTIPKAGHNWEPNLEVISALDVLMRSLPVPRQNHTLLPAQGVNS